MAETDTVDRLHNNPPSSEEIVRESLDERHHALLTRRDELLAGLGRVPDEIVDDDMAGRVSDFAKQLAAAVKKAEAARVDEKEPYLAGGRIVDGYFKKVVDPLKGATETLRKRLTVYQRVKAEAERQRREAVERRQREAAEKAAREAAEKAAALEKEEDLDDALAAEAVARHAEADAIAAAKEAHAKAADLSRTRGDFGAVASLRTRWTFDETTLDRDALDLEALRHHLPTDGIHRALNAFIKAGGRELRGVRIYEDATTVIR